MDADGMVTLTDANTRVGTSATTAPAFAKQAAQSRALSALPVGTCDWPFDLEDP